ncbi:MAG: acyl-CoA thioesterase [Alphaproteobacteria bacterium]|nr:acyl-CoA thioesterase [Alphaproteobacteria bacterium]
MGRFHEQVMGVYFDDLDAFYILHNARYLVLFERTLGSFWEMVGMGSFEPQSAGDHCHLVRANTIEYLMPVRGTGKVRVRVWVQKLGRTSLTFGFRVMPMDRDEDHATGTRTIVRVDPESQKSLPWTDAFRQRVGPWVAEAAT